MTFCQINCMKFKRRSLSITKTIKYSVNQASRNTFMKFHECSFIIFSAFLHIFGVAERIRFYDTEKTQVKLTWFPGTWFIYTTKEDPSKGLSNFEKKKPVAVARPSTIACCRESLDRPVRHILSWRFGHENIATTNHPLPLIPVEQLSADGERIFTKYG